MFVLRLLVVGTAAFVLLPREHLPGSPAELIANARATAEEACAKHPQTCTSLQQTFDVAADEAERTAGLLYALLREELAKLQEPRAASEATAGAGNWNGAFNGQGPASDRGTLAEGDFAVDWRGTDRRPD